MAGILKFNNVEVFGSDGKVTSAGMPSGSILQVQYHQFGHPTDEAGAMGSLSANTNYVVQASGTTSGGGQTGVVDTTITPRITGSSIWLQAHWFGELDAAVTHDSMFFLWRSVGSSHTKLASSYDGGSPTAGEIGISAPTLSYYADNVGTTGEVVSFQFFDAHGVSSGTSVIYKLGFATANGSGMNGLYTNRTQGDATEVGVTSLCAIEIAP